MFGPRTFKVWQLIVTQIFAKTTVNQKRFWSSIRLTGMFYNWFILFECKNILLPKDMGCFIAFIQTAVSRQLTLSAKGHLTACQTSNAWWPNKPCFYVMYPRLAATDGKCMCSLTQCDLRDAVVVSHSPHWPLLTTQVPSSSVVRATN